MDAESWTTRQLFRESPRGSGASSREGLLDQAARAAASCRARGGRDRVSGGCPGLASSVPDRAVFGAALPNGEMVPLYPNAPWDCHIGLHWGGLGGPM